MAKYKLSYALPVAAMAMGTFAAMPTAVMAEASTNSECFETSEAKYATFKEAKKHWEKMAEQLNWSVALKTMF